NGHRAHAHAQGRHQRHARYGRGRPPLLRTLRGECLMRVPLEWLSEHVDLSVVDDAHVLAAEFAGIGLEEEEYIGPDVTGPLVVGRVVTVEPEEHSNGKTINWCSVDVGEAEPRGIVCGAHNFGPGDLVVTALPGAVLPGG